MKFRDYLEEQLTNPEFKKEYDALELEYAIRQLVIDLRRDLKAIVFTLINRFKTKRLEYSEISYFIRCGSAVADALSVLNFLKFLFELYHRQKTLFMSSGGAIIQNRMS